MKKGLFLICFFQALVGVVQATAFNTNTKFAPLTATFTRNAWGTEATNSVVIEINNDDFSNLPINASKGALLDVLSNDTMNGKSVDLSAVTVAIVDSNGLSNIVIDSKGCIVIPADTPVGNYILTYSICHNVNIRNCVTAEVTITIKEPCDFDDDSPVCNILVHNAFSPNNDGKNDIFLIERIENYPDNTVEIFNNSGIVVFQTNGYDNESKVFKGISEGRATINQNKGLPIGNYFYIIRYKKSNTSAIKEKAGYLYLTK